MSLKRKAELTVAVEDENDLLRITPLGAGREVGRSCICLQYKGKTVMLDCGLHAGRSGPNSLPFLDQIDPATVDVLLVSHFHIDHAAAVPYYLERTTFKGRTFMTRPTKGVFRWLAKDYIRVTNTSDSDSTALYNEADLVSAHAKIEEIDVHQQVEVNGIKFTAYNAGHVLGAAMFLVEIAGVKVLYTGDYSREEDRHLVSAENPGVSVSVLITESTYGLRSHDTRIERERNFMKQVRDIVVRRRGCCLLPVSALGRTQELLLILEEHWSRHIQDLDGVPIYFISSLGKLGTRLYQTYIMHMNQRIQQQFNRTGRNPFDFKHIKTRVDFSEVPEGGPCVVLATPGMLQNGVSRLLLERWAPRPENGLIITGYSVEKTLARNITNKPPTIAAVAGGTIPRRLSVDNISFSAHVDYTQNSAFIDEIRAPHVVLVHGEENAMLDLRANLVDKYKNSDYEVTVHTPRNTRAVEMHFHGEKTARVMGSLASKAPRDGDCRAGILVERDFSYTLLDVGDLREFTGMTPVTVEQQLRVPYSSAFGLLQHHLEQMFGELPLTKETSNSGTTNILRIYDAVDVLHSSWKVGVEIEWEGNALNDMVADSVVAVVLNIESSPASVKLTQGACDSHSHSHSNKSDEKPCTVDTKLEASELAPVRSSNAADISAKLALFMKQQFAHVEHDNDQKKFVVRLNELSATVSTVTLDIETDSPLLQSRIAAIIARVRHTMRPLTHNSTPLPERQQQHPDADEKGMPPVDMDMAQDGNNSEKTGGTASEPTQIDNDNDNDNDNNSSAMASSGSSSESGSDNEDDGTKQQHTELPASDAHVKEEPVEDS
ncbi:endoribonuclease ysh1 [Coemansia sp. RSA 1813]|nr:Endoribonuclease YSH1 [Coemansia sp. RSA 1646]KAJ1767585.1 endoribonuclease ysh1 [Coemansia sp. RSA 1843]KAJ2215589.1 endoribonuclease ysh1 [Coemansia sp. RSA 487]KAJ2565444.1 endoribonuclease ysh1 [Coemansia sp. RSA 1813]